MAPLDILAQQIVAECAAASGTRMRCSTWCARATPYATLDARRLRRVVEMLSEGAAPRLGRGRALLHRDRINRTLRGRRAARITALTCGGAIPEVADYRVVLDPDETFIGTVNEDWAIESMAGDVFLLGLALVEDPPRRVGARRAARRGRAGPAAERAVLARRSARRARGSCREEVSRLRRDIASTRLDSDADVRRAG